MCARQGGEIRGSHVQTCRPSVLFVGAIDFHEFGEAVCWLRAHTQLAAARTVTEAMEQCESRQTFWHTIIIAQSRPGQFAPHDIDQLSRAMPLAHLIALLGSCCEGETRSGRCWPGVVRVYWHQFTARAATELRMDVTATSWQLPRTVSDAERADHAAAEPTTACRWTDCHLHTSGGVLRCPRPRLPHRRLLVCLDSPRTMVERARRRRGAVARPASH